MDLGVLHVQQREYERSVFKTGSFFGTPEEALEIGAIYLA